MDIYKCLLSKKIMTMIKIVIIMMMVDENNECIMMMMMIDDDEAVELVTTHPKIPVSFQKSDLEYC